MNKPRVKYYIIILLVIILFTAWLLMVNFNKEKISLNHYIQTTETSSSTITPSFTNKELFEQLSKDITKFKEEHPELITSDTTPCTQKPDTKSIQ
jgi:hypothetical protein